MIWTTFYSSPIFIWRPQQANFSQTNILITIFFTHKPRIQKNVSNTCITDQFYKITLVYSHLGNPDVLLFFTIIFRRKKVQKKLSLLLLCLGSMAHKLQRSRGISHQISVSTFYTSWHVKKPKMQFLFTNWAYYIFLVQQQERKANSLQKVF